MPRVKLAEIMDSDPEDSSNSLGTDSSVNDMDDVPEEYAMGFSESIPQPWVKPSNKRATFVDPPLMKKSFLDPPSSGLLLGMDKTMKPAFDSSDCRVLGEFVEKPSYQVVLFEEGGSFVRRLESAGVAEAIRTSAGLGIQRNGSDMSLPWQRWCFRTHTFLTSWGEFSPTLEDVVDLTLLRPDSDLLKLARHLQMSLSDAGRYAKELSKSRQAKKSSSKNEHPKTRRSLRGKEVVGDKQDSKKKKITVNILTLIGLVISLVISSMKFSLFAPIHKPPTILPDKKASPRAWIWGSAHPSKSLEDVIDLEENFCFRPDFHCGALICPVIYRPDRVLFQEELPKYNPFLVVPLDRDGGVTMEYVDYLMRMKEHIRQYEGTSVPDVRSFVPVLIKDPYFMTGNLSPSTITNLNARCYRHPPSSKRKPDDSVVTAEVVKRSKVESSNVEVVKRSLERPPRPSVDATPSPISTGSGIFSSSTAKAKGSSAAACFVESSQSPGKAVVSLSSSIVKRRSHRLLGKLKTIPNAPSDLGTTQEVVRDGLPAKASSKRNVDIESGVTCQGDPTRRVVTPIRTIFPGAASHAASESTFQTLSTSKITKEPLASASSVSVRDEFEHFNGDAKNLLSEIASRAPSFLLPNDLNCLFKKLGYQAFLDAWDFFTSHSLADLWGAHRDMVENHLNNLKLFKFSGRWLENLSAKFEPPPGISDLAREELLSKEHHILSSDVSALQEKVNKLTSELNTLKARLASVSMEREQLAKHKEAASSVISYSDILWL
ncbi:CHD3-type chromatin-remodeling factor PICKLE [Arachis hypogaea]|nr:CHD3-type chromatin-remodeling factor PICKLE [Arachis hypogaea]